MRAILHAKFDAHVAKLSSTSDKVTGISPSPGLRDSSVEEFEAALTKARGADSGPTRHRAASVETSLGVTSPELARLVARTRVEVRF